MKFPTSKRARRVSGEIRKVAAEFTRAQVEPKFPGIMVSVPEVRVSDDLSLAAVYVSILGTDDPAPIQKEMIKRQKDMRQAAAQALHIRRIPEFRFVWDDTMERADRIEQLLKQVNNSSSSHPEGTSGVD